MSKDYCEEIVHQLELVGNVTYRFMFGGYGLYLDGIIFAIIADNELYFKVDDTNKQDYLDYDSVPFTFESKGKSMSMSYYLVPQEVLDDIDLLCGWAKKSYNVSLKSKTKKKR